jgi:hypothetical protein
LATTVFGGHGIAPRPIKEGREAVRKRDEAFGAWSEQIDNEYKARVKTVDIAVLAEGIADTEKLALVLSCWGANADVAGNFSPNYQAVIDPDAIRDLLPGYSGANSYLFQRAVSIAVDDLFRHILKHQQSAFVDGTLSDYTKAKQNISAVIDHHDVAMICFVFQHPVIAWHFTQLREAVEGRNIRKEDFIDKFLGAKTTVDKLKTDFGDKLNLNIILKDYKDTKENRAVAKVFTNVKSVDECLTFDYTKASIERILP